MRETPSELPGSGKSPDPADPAGLGGPAEPVEPVDPAAPGPAGPSASSGPASDTSSQPSESAGSKSSGSELSGPGHESAGRESGSEASGHGSDAQEFAEIGHAILSGATYGMLFVLGVFLGVVGAMAHSWVLGGLPVAAIGLIAVVFAVPYAMGRLMGTRLGAAATAVGWGLVSAVFAAQRGEGDLLIAGNGAGNAGPVYLYGGMVAMAMAVMLVPSSNSWLLTPRFGAVPPDDASHPSR